MRAGAMKYRLTLLRPPLKAEDKYGAEELKFEATRTVWAERVKFSGRRSEETGEHFPDYSAQFNIRDAHPIGENWRVRLCEDLYTVTNIIPNRDRGFNTLICERVNE